ncbi:MAG: hypothetical protein ACRDK9_08100 [Solirubrobacterales bacterium]
MVDDPERLRGEGEGALPTAYLHPFDRSMLAEDNLADMSTIAHRRLAEARFREDLQMHPDWDLLQRLTAIDEQALALPALACFYLTDAPDRLSAVRSGKREAAQLRLRAQER